MRFRWIGMHMVASGPCESEAAAKRAAVEAATGRDLEMAAAPLEEGEVTALWRSLERKGWRIEEVVGSA